MESSSDHTEKGQVRAGPVLNESDVDVAARLNPSLDAPMDPQVAARLRSACSFLFYTGLSDSPLKL